MTNRFQSVWRKMMSNINQGVYPGDVVQIDPESDECFGGCYVYVQEVRDWGIVGYVRIPGAGEKGGNAYLRKKFSEFVLVGRSPWMEVEKPDDESL